MREVDPERVLALQALVKAEKARLAAVKADPARFYRPHAKQDEFHRAGDKLRRVVFAGNRFGKSHLGAAEDAAWLRGERVWYAEDDPARTLGIPQRPTKGLVICADWDKVGEIWTEETGAKPGKIWSMLPRNFVVRKGRNSSGVIDTIVCKNGSILRFDTVKSFMTNPLGSESSDWDFIHGDEPFPHKMWQATSRGLMDRNGAAWFTLTAISEPWLFDSCTEQGWWYIYGSTYDNPTLTPDAIAAFEAELTPEERECRLHGKPLHMAGLVYKQFQPDLHILREKPLGWAAFDKPPADYTIYVRIDTHPQVPHAVLFCAVSPTGHRFYYDELFEQVSIARLCDLIKKRLHGRTLGNIKVEPAAWVLDPITKTTSVAKEFAACGLPVQKAVKDLSGGINRVKQSLEELPPRIHFSPGMQRTLWEIKRYCWDPNGTNKPRDEEDHMMENLYRCEIDRPVWQEPAQKEFFRNRKVKQPKVAMTSLSTADLDDRMDIELELAV